MNLRERTGVYRLANTLHELSEDAMRQRDRLPACFPNVTKYVIEGRNGHIFSEYLELPDGRRIDLLPKRTPADSRDKLPKHRPKVAA